MHRLQVSQRTICMELWVALARDEVNRSERSMMGILGCFYEMWVRTPLIESLADINVIVASESVAINVISVSIHDTPAMPPPITTYDAILTISQIP